MRARTVVVASSFVVSFLALGIVKARVALADPVAPAPVVAPAAPLAPLPWTFSTGFGFVSWIGGANAGGLGGLALPLGGFVTMERSLAGPLSLMVRVSGSVGWSSADRDDDGTVIGQSYTMAYVRGGAGLKLSFGSRDVIEVSPFALLDGAHGYSDSGVYTSRSSSIGGDLGVSIDRDIVRGFGIRLSATLVTADHSWDTSTFEDTSTTAPDTLHTSRSSSTNVALTLAPAAELRWSF